MHIHIKHYLLKKFHYLYIQYIQPHDDLKNVDMSEELKCPVCLGLCTRPRECIHCGRLFCAPCIAHLKSCPLCRKEPFISRETRFATRLVDNVRVKCGQCEALVTSARLEEHKKTCICRHRRCRFDGCHYVATNREDGMNHLINIHMDQLWSNFDHIQKIITSSMLGLFILIIYTSICIPFSAYLKI